MEGDRAGSPGDAGKGVRAVWQAKNILNRRLRLDKPNAQIAAGCCGKRIGIAVYRRSRAVAVEATGVEHCSGGDIPVQEIVGKFGND